MPVFDMDSHLREEYFLDEVYRLDGKFAHLRPVRLNNEASVRARFKHELSPWPREVATDEPTGLIDTHGEWPAACPQISQRRTYLPRERAVHIIESRNLGAIKKGEREVVLKQGRRKVLNRGQTLFSQGARHDGIWLVESGRVRVFYISPLGREITLAYWQAGNFVGGPEVFDTGVHQWSGVASTNCSVVQLPGKELRT